MDALLQGNLWPYDWIQSCFGRHIKGIFRQRRLASLAAPRRQDLQSELEVTGLLPIHCAPAEGGAPWMETRLGATDSRPHAA